MAEKRVSKHRQTAQVERDATRKSDATVRESSTVAIADRIASRR